MKRIIIVAIAALALSGCAQTAQKTLEVGLTGKFANPMASVLLPLCTTQCNADACLDYNSLGNVCANGLPVQGLIGSEIRQVGCPDLGYSTTGPFTVVGLPASCVQPLPTPAPAKTSHLDHLDELWTDLHQMHKGG